MQYHKLNLGRLGYQKRKHRVLLAPTPGNQQEAKSLPPASIFDLKASTTVETKASTSVPVPPAIMQDTALATIFSSQNSVTGAQTPRLRNKRKREGEKLKEEWRGLYWFRGLHMEAILEDYGSSYDGHYNKRVSRRLASCFRLTTG